MKTGKKVQEAKQSKPILIPFSVNFFPHKTTFWKDRIIVNHQQSNESHANQKILDRELTSNRQITKTFDMKLDFGSDLQVLEECQV